MIEFERNGIILFNKNKRLLSILSASCWLIIIIYVFGLIISYIPKLGLDTIANRELFKFSIFILVIPVLLTLYFDFFKSFKLDFVNNELTIKSHFPFWTRESKHLITKKKLIEIGQNNDVPGTRYIQVKINDQIFKLFDELYPSDLKKRLEFLRRYDFNIEL